MAQSSSSGWRAVPRAVWAIDAFLPVSLVSTLGASTTLVGLIEGIGKGAASVTKVFSGAVSDWFERRKVLAVLGQGLGTLTKPVFALAVTPFEVLAARLLDRVGKGIRGAARDAPVADVTPDAAGYAAVLAGSGQRWISTVT